MIKYDIQKAFERLTQVPSSPDLHHAAALAHDQHSATMTSSRADHR